MVLVQRTLFVYLVVVLSSCGGDNNIALGALVEDADVCADETEALLRDRDVDNARLVIESRLQWASSYEVVCNHTRTIIDAYPDDEITPACELQIVDTCTNDYVQAFETACESKGGKIHSLVYITPCDEDNNGDERTWMQFFLPACVGVSCNATQARTEFNNGRSKGSIVHGLLLYSGVVDACSREVSAAPSGKSVIGVFFLSATLLYLS